MWGFGGKWEIYFVWCDLDRNGWKQHGKMNKWRSNPNVVEGGDVDHKKKKLKKKLKQGMNVVCLYLV